MATMFYVFLMLFGENRSLVLPILCSPTFDEAHAYCAHAGELVDGFEALADRLRKKSGEFLIVKNFQIAPCKDK